MIGHWRNRVSETKRGVYFLSEDSSTENTPEDKEARPAVRAKAGRGEGLIDHVYIQGQRARGGAQAGLRCFLD